MSLQRRYESTTAIPSTSSPPSPPHSPSSISTSTSPSASSSTRIVASILLSRPPRRRSPLSTFEKEYYRYARRINKATSSPFDPEWYFRKGSQGEQAWKELAATEQAKELEDSDKVVVEDEKSETDFHNVDRKQDRTLYMLAKKDRAHFAWQCPQGGLEGKESLSQAALRELLEEFGAELDVWQTGKVPAAWHAYSLPQPTNEGHSETKASLTKNPSSMTYVLSDI
ncbi:MAG: 54S ribosomal protein L17 mitochondrial [Cyphobasidiales sp. Tagirdzhanova-0007]|nr:MAG: 54S ribosomal protein L17 mitochondrial [Cyphobasidiales sp. Tagirdzhanova-0007]